MKIILTEKEVCDAVSKEHGKRLMTDDTQASLLVCTTLFYNEADGIWGAEMTLAEKDPK